MRTPKRPSNPQRPKKLATPITYETDPAILEKERRQRAAENRAKMRQKRQKQMNRKAAVANEFKEATITTKKIKEKEEMLSEDSTQPTNSLESIEKSVEKSMEKTNSKEKTEEKNEKPKVSIEKKQVRPTDNQPIPPKIEDHKSKMSMSGSGSDEDIGDIQLVSHDPYAAAKKHIIKKRAQELARKMQHEDVLRKRLERENYSAITSPDDTLKNISSIQLESQLSLIQRKKQQLSKEGPSGESQDATLMEPKSNELYIRDIPERAMG